MTYSKEKADHAVNWIQKHLQLVEGEKGGKPFILETWQAEMVRKIFGTLNEDGTRQYRTVFLFVARKNGKSPISAALALYLLFTEHEPLGQIYIAAADRDQAGIILRHASEMVLRNKQLKDRAEVWKSSIRYPRTGSFLRAITSKANTKHGFSASGVFIDELHAHPDRELFDVLVTSTSARRQPLTFITTTAGSNVNTICYQIYEKACKIRDGVIIDPTFLPVIFETDKNDEIGDEKIWRKANPGLGTIKKMDYMRAKYADVLSDPGEENTFRQLDLNQWVTSEVRWIGDHDWMKCKGGTSDEDLLGQDVILGMDISANRDITSICLWFPGYSERKVLRWVHFVPQATMDKRGAYQKDYMTWAKAGHIIRTSGNVVDYNRIKEEIESIGSRYSILRIGFDPFMSQFLIPQLVDAGFDCVPVGQDIRTMGPATKNFEKLVYSEGIEHDGNPVARWMMANCMVYRDPNGNIKVNKGKSTGKVDGIIAAIVASSLDLGGDVFGSMYDTEDFATLG